MEGKENSYSTKILEAEKFMSFLTDLPDSEENRLHLKKFENMIAEFKNLEMKKIENDHEKDNQALLVKVLGICEKQVSRIDHYVSDCDNFILMTHVLLPKLNDEEKSLLEETKANFVQLKERCNEIQKSFDEIMQKKIVDETMVSSLKELDKESSELETNLTQIKNCYFSVARLAKQSNSTRETLKNIPENYMNGFNDRLKSLSKRISNIENQSLKGSTESLASHKVDSENYIDDYQLLEASKKRISMTSQQFSRRKSDCKNSLRPGRMNSTLCNHTSENLSPHVIRRTSDVHRSTIKYKKDSEIEYLIDKLNYLQNEIKFTQHQLSDAIRRQNDTINDQINMVISTRNFNSRFQPQDSHFYEEEDTPVEDHI